MPPTTRGSSSAVGVERYDRFVRIARFLLPALLLFACLDIVNEHFGGSFTTKGKAPSVNGNVFVTVQMPVAAERETPVSAESKPASSSAPTDCQDSEPLSECEMRKQHNYCKMDPETKTACALTCGLCASQPSLSKSNNDKTVSSASEQAGPRSYLTPGSLNVYADHLKSVNIESAPIPDIDPDAFDMNVYDNQKPVVVRGAVKWWPALKKWTQPHYLYEALKNLDLPVVSQKKVFLRGTDDFEAMGTIGNDLTRLFKSYDPTSEWHHYTGMSATSGSSLAPDLEPLPKLFDKLPWETRTAKLWASNGDIDSGLHFDENKGGFVMTVVGEKHVCLFPNGDAENLYMRNGYESGIFILKDITMANRAKYSKVWNAHPMVATLKPGDLLYIPHRWFHEVYSPAVSISITGWIHDTN